MATQWEEIYTTFYDKIEKDKEFFAYYNTTPEEAMEIVKQRSKSLLLQSISRLLLSCTPDVNFNDYNSTTEAFNFDCTLVEKDLMAEIMREKLFDKDKSLLKVFETRFSPKDLNTFSPAQERKTFVDMCDGIVKLNNNHIDEYKSRDRITGKLKIIDYSKYNES